jgi:serine/threonine protein kinase
VGAWRLVEWAGGGTHGAVYRAVQVDKEHSAPIALKLALLPHSPRFAREAELLSRLRNPSIPRLWEAGLWQSPSGEPFPFLAMEWVDGVSLYSWAQQHSPSPQQVRRLFAQLARALHSVHSLGGLHRDVKGANVLVRSSDSRAMLMDFGSGIHPEAPTLTPPDFYPGTPAYRSPESGLFELNSLRDRSARYRAGPADDLFALGVTACRMLTGKYPAFADPEQDEHGTWHMEAVQTPAELLDVEPSLRAWVLRLLSVRPEERGTALQLAEELEGASHEEGPSHHPLATWAWQAAVAVGLMLVVGLGWAFVQKLEKRHSLFSAAASRSSQADAGTSGLGETAASASSLDSPEPSLPEAMADDTLPEPVPDQLRPDVQGHCPRKRHVVLNGACWVPFSREECEDLGNGHLFRGKCYMPAFARPGRPSTSYPPRKP